jgi:hypothetical protein
MRNLIFISIIGAMAALFMGCEKKASPVERDKYLVTGIGCNDCHTPWKMGPQWPGAG